VVGRLHRKGGAEGVDAGEFPLERQGEFFRLGIFEIDRRDPFFRVNFRQAPVNEGAAAIRLTVDKTAQSGAQFPTAQKGRIAELVRQRREGGKCRLHRIIAPHEPPVFESVPLIVRRQHEDEVAVHAEKLHGDHHLRQKFGDDHLLFRRVCLETGHVAVGLAHPLHVAAVFGKPDRAVLNFVLLQKPVKVCQQLRAFAQPGVGVNVEDVKVTLHTIFHDDIRIGRQVGMSERSDGDGEVGISGLEAEVGGLEGRCIIPCPFRREADILLVPEFPYRHFAAKCFRQFLGETVGRHQVAGQMGRVRLRPFRRVVVHAGKLYPAFREQRGVGHVLAPVELAGRRFAFSPAQAVPNHLQAGPAGHLRHDRISVAGMAAVGRIGTRQPALRTVQRKEHLRIARLDGGVRDDRKAAEPLKWLLRRGELQRIIAVGQRLQKKFPFSGPASAAQHLALPVFQRPFRQEPDGRLQGEPDRFSLKEGRSGSLCRNHLCNVTGRRSGRFPDDLDVAEIEGQLFRAGIHADPQLAHGRGIFHCARQRDGYLLVFRFGGRQREIRHSVFKHHQSVQIARRGILLHRAEFKPDGRCPGKRFVGVQPESGITPVVGIARKLRVKPDGVFPGVAADGHGPGAVFLEPFRLVQPGRPGQDCLRPGKQGACKKKCCSKSDDFHWVPNPEVFLLEIF